MLFKLPSAYFSGVRLKSIDDKKAVVRIKHGWKNQNPFRSMYFAVQSMGAELTTGALVISKIKESGKNISMLVTHHEGSFTKKATGKITFTCSDGDLINDAISKTITTGEGQKIRLSSIGLNEKNEQVSAYSFEWSIRLRS